MNPEKAARLHHHLPPLWQQARRHLLTSPVASTLGHIPHTPSQSLTVQTQFFQKMSDHATPAQNPPLPSTCSRNTSQTPFQVYREGLDSTPPHSCPLPTHVAHHSWEHWGSLPAVVWARARAPISPRNSSLQAALCPPLPQVTCTSSYTSLGHPC